MSSEDTGTLKKLIVRLKCGDKGRIGLKDVVEKLETCISLSNTYFTLLHNKLEG